MRNRYILVLALSAIGTSGVAFGGSVAAFAPASGQMVAATPAYQGDSSNYYPIGNDGLVFTVGDTPISVTALGYFHDGTVHANPVGIFDLSNDQLVTPETYVTTTAGLLPIPSFDYTTISPVTLAADHQYEVVGFEDTVVADASISAISAQYESYLADANPAPGITLNSYMYDYNTSFDLTTLPGTPYDPAYFGPNFEFTVGDLSSDIPVPAPSTIFGFGSILCLCGLTFVARRYNARAL
jgi:hypothetical protein